MRPPVHPKRPAGEPGCPGPARHPVARIALLGHLACALCAVAVDIPPPGHATGADGATIAVWDATLWQRDPVGRWRIAADISTRCRRACDEYPGGPASYGYRT
jgi:hypothetical protein